MSIASYQETFSNSVTVETLELIPPGKIRCFATGKLRPDTPEESVRQRIARSLIEEYGYQTQDMGIEFTIKLGVQRKRVDIVIFRTGTEHKQENAVIIAECKREDIRPSDAEQGVKQLSSYLAACLNAKFGLWVGSELQVLEKTSDSHGNLVYEQAADIPRNGSDRPLAPKFSDLRPAEELRSVFRRCHNYIYGNQGLAKDVAFKDLIRLIFCKVHDEYTASQEMSFYISNEERRSDLGRKRLKQRIDHLFESVKYKYSYIFAPDEQIGLSENVLAYVVSELQRYSLLVTKADIKGVAYEELVGSNLRGDRGEFFTPRNVCEMATKLAFLTYPRDQWNSLKVLDPACGTGGFLVDVLKLWRDRILVDETEKWKNVNPFAALESTEQKLKEAANQYLFGIDFNPTLVKAAQMNLVMHGDGSTNVLHADSLLPPGEWVDAPGNPVRTKARLGEFDIVLTNPPFGSNIQVDDPAKLREFTLAEFGLSTGQRRSSMPPEQLFIERALQFLKPGGRLAIVLPDSILSNPGLIFIREWILERCKVVASIDLPQETFEPHTGTQTSVLLLQKKTEMEINLERISHARIPYDIFMAMPKAVGHDQRGNPLYLRTPEGDIVEYEVEIDVVRRASDGTLFAEKKKDHVTALHDELPEVVRFFSDWISQVNQQEMLSGTKYYPAR